MILRTLAMALVVGLAVVGLSLPDPPLILWEVLVIAAMGTVAWRGLPPRPPRFPSLIGFRVTHVPPARVLAPLELEVSGSCDPRLGGDRRIRRRLLALLYHRVGVRQPAFEQGTMGKNAMEGLATVAALSSRPPGMDDRAWEVLLGDGVTSLDELETIVSQIEEI